MQFYSINRRKDGWNFLYQNLEIQDYKFGQDPKGKGLYIPYWITIILQILFSK